MPMSEILERRRGGLGQGEGGYDEVGGEVLVGGIKVEEEEEAGEREEEGGGKICLIQGGKKAKERSQSGPHVLGRTFSSYPPLLSFSPPSQQPRHTQRLAWSSRSAGSHTSQASFHTLR